MGFLELATMTSEYTRHVFRSKQGNVALMMALTMPIILYVMSLGLDYGMLTMQQRRLQETADLAALVAASDVNNAEADLLNFFQQNSLNMAIQTSSGYVSNGGILALTDPSAQTAFDGIATMVLGTYVADPTIAVGSRFVADASPYDAVKLTLRQSGQLVFATSFATPPTLGVASTASAQKVAAFSIGSGLASLNNGLVNAVLGSLLGTNLSLSAMDYNSLLSTNINALSTMDTLATNLSLTGGSYNDLLNTQVKFADLLNAIGDQGALTTAAQSAVNSIQTAANSAQIKVNFGQILNLGPLGQHMVGSGSHLAVTTNILDLINAAALAANGNKQVAVDLSGTVPGLTSIQLTLAIGEPPVSTPSLAVGAVGTVVRTAQTRLKLTISINGLSLLLGTKVQLPIYVQAASAVGQLSSIACLGNGAQNANVSVATPPGVADLYIGNVDTTNFSNFSYGPTVTPATLVNVLNLISATASAHVALTNIAPTMLTFSPSDIATRTTKTASTTNTLQTAIASLLTNTTYGINILFVTLNTQAMYQQALATTLAGITAPLDDLLNNLLLLTGVKIGQADVTVTDVRCQQPVLVQ